MGLQALRVHRAFKATAPRQLQALSMVSRA